MTKLILTSLLLVSAKPAFVQNNTSAGSSIYFGAIAGTKVNNLDNHFIINANPRLYSFSIGAGSAWTKNKYIIGLEFLYLAANNKNDNGEIQYTGFSNTLFIGYNLAKKSNWKIEPLLGIVANNNQLIIQDNTGNQFQYLINNQLCGNIGLSIKAIGKNNLFTGVKLGYVLPFSGETEWKTKLMEKRTGLNDNLGGFYLQLNLGGLLSLSNKK